MGWLTSGWPVRVITTTRRSRRIRCPDPACGDAVPARPHRWPGQLAHHRQAPRLRTTTPRPTNTRMSRAPVRAAPTADQGVSGCPRPDDARPPRPAGRGGGAFVGGGGGRARRAGGRAGAGTGPAGTTPSCSASSLHEVTRRPWGRLAPADRLRARRHRRGRRGARPPALRAGRRGRRARVRGSRLGGQRPAPGARGVPRPPARGRRARGLGPRPPGAARGRDGGADRRAGRARHGLPRAEPARGRHHAPGPGLSADPGGVRPR